MTYNAGQANHMHQPLWRWVGLFALTLSFFMAAPGGRSQAAGFASPKECQSSIGEAHLTCLYSYIERQQQNTAMAESDMSSHEGIREQRPVRQTQVDPLSSIVDEQGGQADRAEPDIPIQPAAAPARSSDTITPGVGSPTECRAYSGPAHLNCLYAYIELQHSKSGKVEEEVNAQRQTLGQLRDQMDRQASASQDLQRRLAERDAAASSSSPAYIAPPIYPGFGYSGYGYPGYGYSGFGYPGFGYSAPGFSLYLGSPGYYWGRPLYGPRFFGPRFGHHHR